MEGKMNGFKDLIVWQKSMDLTVEIYKLTKYFPKEEHYSLTNQIHRAAVSIPSNIAEGKGRNSKAEYLHFIAIAQVSLAETETQLILAIRLGYITEEQASKSLLLREEISKMLYSLRCKLSDT
jgi:four helix bundle protein